MSEIFHSSKQFVNLPGCNSDASIFSQIIFYSPEHGGHDVILKMRDCSNTIHFSIGLAEEGDRSYTNSLFKLDVLISELSKFRESLVKAKDIHDEREKADELRMAQHKEQFEKNTYIYEVDPGHNNPPPVSSVSDPTTAPVRGLEDI